MSFYVVEFTPPARADLWEITGYIASEASVAIAKRYVEGVKAFCMDFETLLQRGTRIGRGRRQIGYRKTATIIFRIDARRVRILRVLYRGQDVAQIGK